jgi:lysozyme
MNEDLQASEQCFRIIRTFETAPRDWPQTREGAALKAYKCPSGQWTIGFGCCFWLDGNPVKEGDTLVPEQVGPLLRYNLRKAEARVRELVEVGLSQFQFDALVSFQFNVRWDTLAKSSALLPAINAGRWEDAAREFSKFIYGGGAKNGQPWERAMAGLLRRRLSEACVFLGFDWEDACDPDAVALRTETHWIESRQIWRDRVVRDATTQWATVLAVARLYPLAEAHEPFEPEIEDKPEPVAETPVPGPAPAPAPPAVRLPPEADPKDMVLSRRFWGHIVVLIGSVNAWFAALVKNEAARELMIWAGIILAGLALRWLGERYAKRGLA